MRQYLEFTLALCCCCSPLGAAAQTAYPSAPTPQLNLWAQAMPPASPTTPPAGQMAPASNPPSGPRLTRAQAERMAIQNNPRVSVGKLLALAQHQVVREAHAPDLPTLVGSATAMDSENYSRMAAGSLTSSRLFEHAAAGASLNQLITDFGRTHNLVLTQKLQEKAANASALATVEDVVLVTDQAFYNALSAQALLKVAQQTVDTRQITETQVNEMTQNKLRSTLDLAFADVTLSQAKLLQLDARRNADAAMAALDAVLGLDHSQPFSLVDDTAPLPAPPQDAQQLIRTALDQRPDLQSMIYGQQSAQKFARAQWDQILPSISALGTAGNSPIHADLHYTQNWWGGIGVNMNIPIFNGFLYTAEAKEAAYRAKAASESARNLRDQIVRDVQTTFLSVNAAYQRVAVTAQLLQEANLALQLSEARYQLGLSSIVELSQAQLQQTSADIENTNAQYQYHLELAVLNYEIGVQP